MTVHHFTSGSPDERRAWVTEIAREMREEAASKHRVAATLDRGARDLETCDAEAGEIPVPPLALAIYESICPEEVALVLGVRMDFDVINAELERLLGKAP